MNTPDYTALKAILATGDARWNYRLDRALAPEGHEWLAAELQALHAFAVEADPECGLPAYRPAVSYGLKSKWYAAVVEGETSVKYPDWAFWETDPRDVVAAGWGEVRRWLTAGIPHDLLA